jgi:4-hydroxy 2-oxovalerate aldolase
MSMAQEYYDLMVDLGIDVVEVGYWGQTSKTSNPFYNMDREVLKLVTREQGLGNCSIMVDYHYCPKKLSSYPTADEQQDVTMIRLCSRKQDIEAAMEFARTLKEQTGLAISINAFNISNYLPSELMEVGEQLAQGPSDYVYFADTHGALDLQESYDRVFGPVVQILRQGGKQVGLHFHNHTGREYANYLAAVTNGIDMSDTTVFGIGKGAGNLRLEHVLDRGKLLPLMAFIQKYHDILSIGYNPYYPLSGAHSVCEAYAVQAKEMGLSLEAFDQFCRNMPVSQKDVYDRGLLQERGIL